MGCKKLQIKDYFRVNSKGLLAEKVGGTTNLTNGTNKNVFKYGFDQIGNRTQFSSRKAAKKQSILLAYNDLNQITTASPAKLGMASMLAGDYQYDVYGNMVATPKANYRYNLNNRLVEVNQKDSKLAFAYDGMGRRTTKKVYKKSSIANWSLIADYRFLYSGFKCVAEINALSNKVEKFYQWQGEQLLGVYNPETEKSLSVLTDGNKNVIGLMGSNGDISARFAYSPFGQLLSSQGASTAESSFRFSSEYRDKETGLVYYNFRYLSPELGRWLSRDPIKEFGGVNLYGVVSNAIINKFDIYGLSCAIVEKGSPTTQTWTIWRLSEEKKWSNEYVSTSDFNFALSFAIIGERKGTLEAKLTAGTGADVYGNKLTVEASTAISTSVAQQLTASLTYTKTWSYGIKQQYVDKWKEKTDYETYSVTYCCTDGDTVSTWENSTNNDMTIDGLMITSTSGNYVYASRYKIQKTKVAGSDVAEWLDVYGAFKGGVLSQTTTSEAAADLWISSDATSRATSYFTEGSTTVNEKFGQ